jgi:Raf kinase inhibitor-like YbhB/YbcL family protein
MTRTKLLAGSGSLAIFTLALAGCGGADAASCPQTPPPSAAPTAIAAAAAPTVAPAPLPASGASDLSDPNKAPATLKVTLGNGSGTIPMDNVFNGFGCTGKNQSLAVSWSGAPANAQSFAIILHDPDAPTGVGFFHWSVFNLPKTTTSLAAGASSAGLPPGAMQGYTDFGMNGYGGPCPPPGAPHRYIATVYALDTAKLEAPAGATGALLRFMLGQHAVALGRATATFGR